MGAVQVDERALLGALAAFKSLDADTRRETARAVRGTLTPLWRKVIDTKRRYAEGTVAPAQDALVGAGTASFTSGGRGTLRAYTGGKALSGGLGNDRWHAVEFGSGGRHGQRGQLPRRRSSGRIAYRGVQAWAPTAARVYLGVLYDVLRQIPGAQDGA